MRASNAQSPQSRETPIAGVPMPDLGFLTGQEYRQIYQTSSDMMTAAMAQMAAANQNKDGDGSGS